MYVQPETIRTLVELMNEPIASLESFPNELLLELFEYISPDHLYQTFFHLNTRFHSLIHSLRNLRVILVENWDDHEYSVPFYASQISSLIIKHDHPMDFSFYRNLRSLKLSRPTNEQCNAIQSTFLPNLEHLFISNFYFSDRSEQLCQSIFSSTFPCLQTCQIDRMTFTSSHSLSTSSLRQLTISPSTWKSNFYPIIFQSCPNLTDLRIQRLRKLPFALSFDHLFSHSALRSFKIHFHSLGSDWFEQINWLLSIPSNLENFTLIIEQNETNHPFPLKIFAHLLNHRAPCLLNFHAKLAVNHFLLEQPETIQRLHPLFFHVQFARHTNRNLPNYLLISSKQ